jgi:hypothetical protein
MVEIDLNDWFIYDETSPSCLRWNVSRSGGNRGQIPLVRVGDAAGWIDNNGYFIVQLNGVIYTAQRVIWTMFNGKIPEGHFIDHINGVRNNNTLSNLRSVHRDFNSRNTKMYKSNSSGITGVQYISRDGTFYFSAIWRDLNGKSKSKSFSTTKYGKDEAFRLACLYREAMIASLNEQGAGYTHDHGKR